MMARPECPGKGDESLCAYIEKANSYRPPTGIVRAMWFVIVAVVSMLSIMYFPLDVNCLFAIIAAFLAPVMFLFCKFLYFQKTNEFAYGLSYLQNGDWWYVEMYFRERKSYFFGRIMRSPAFILIAGFYYQLKAGDMASAERLLDLARERAPELEMIEMTPSRGLLRKDREVLMERFMKDLGVTWIYKLKQKKLLWATGGLLLFLLFVIRQIMILVESGGLLIKGLSE